MHLDGRTDKCILNFLPIVKGGGMQNALGLVAAIGKMAERRDRCIVLTRKNTALFAACRDGGFAVIGAANHLLGRLMLELQCRARFSRDQPCLTLFGPPPIGSLMYLNNIVGCAYSNLFYPEIPFWSELPPAKQLRARAIDGYRKTMLQQADHWIFETEALRKRAVTLAGFPPQRTTVVRMAPTRTRSPHLPSSDTAPFNMRMPSAFRFLFLAGAHPNKRLHLLPHIAVELARLTFAPFVFVTTLEQTNPYTCRVLDAFAQHGIQRQICNIGPVPPDKIDFLIACVDVMCTFSALESFSNNFVEAWQMERPLIVTDADWSRDSCRDAAIYVDPGDPVATATKLHSIMVDDTFRRGLVEKGRAVLRSYPTASDKVLSYFMILDQARRLGQCSSAERSGIVWPRLTGLSPATPKQRATGECREN